VKKIIGILATVILLAILVMPSIPVLADDGKGLKVGDRVVLDKGVTAEFLGKEIDGSYKWKATISAPKYLDDLKTPIDCSWDYNLDKGEWSARANLFSAIVKGSKVTVDYQGTKLSWQPDVFVGTKKQAVLTENAQLLMSDPINENYYGNTLQWTYGGITRNLRIIEGMLIEYYTIGSMPSDDIRIVPHVAKDAGFVYTRPSVAWDADNEPVNLIADDAGVLTLTMDAMKQATFPITIDPDTSFTTSASDGVIGRVETGTYAANHDAANGSSAFSSSTWTFYSLGQSFYSPDYALFRVPIYFDTSSLPDNSSVTAATLKLYGRDDKSDTNFNITIQTGTSSSYPADPFTLADYNYTHYTGDGGSLTTVGFTIAGYNSITLNATGRGWINKTGATKFMVRSSRDISSTPPTGEEKVQIWFYEKGTGYWPTLDVTYTASAAPTVTTDAASNIAMNTTRLNSSVVDDGGGDVTESFGWDLHTHAAVADYAWTGNAAGTYNTGQHPYLDISGLTGSTLYYFRTAGTNDQGTTQGGELTFTTASSVANVTGFKAFPQATSVSLTWSAATGASQYWVKWQTGSYPTLTTGTQVYLGTSTSTAHAGLTAGKTYYYSVWGKSGGDYSTGYATVMATTSAAGVAGEGLPTPGTPSRWMSAPDYENLVNLPVVYDMVNNLSDSIEMPRATMWMMLALGLATVFGLGLYLVSGKKLMVGTIALTLALVFGWVIKIVPFWIPLLAIILIVAISIGRREVEY